MLHLTTEQGVFNWCSEKLQNAQNYNFKNHINTFYIIQKQFHTIYNNLDYILWGIFKKMNS